MDDAHTPPARARAPSGSEEDSDEEHDATFGHMTFDHRRSVY
jgi:hypothetical protein